MRWSTTSLRGARLAGAQGLSGPLLPEEDPPGEEDEEPLPRAEGVLPESVPDRRYVDEGPRGPGTPRRRPPRAAGSRAGQSRRARPGWPGTRRRWPSAWPRWRHQGGEVDQLVQELSHQAGPACFGHFVRPCPRQPGSGHVSGEALASGAELDQGGLRGEHGRSHWHALLPGILTDDPRGPRADWPAPIGTHGPNATEPSTAPRRRGAGNVSAGTGPIRGLRLSRTPSP